MPGQLETIRTKLFYGLSRYTKSFPDFSISQKFEMASPRRGDELLREIEASVAREQEYMLYIHLPFCHLECTFCNTAPRKTNGRQQRDYLESLLREIDINGEAGLFEGRKLRCIFFGGGTPTIYSNAALERILDKVRSYATFCDDHNITCEAHPEGLVKNNRLAELGELGIHRISVGSQSFDPRVLHYIDRKSHQAQVAEVVERAKAAGVSINVDMMLGLPGQTLANVREDLDILSDMAPDSIEYMRHEIVNPLAVAIFKRDPDLMVSDDDLFQMVLETAEWMEARGYQHNGCFEEERFFPFRYHWLHETPFIGLGSRSRSYTKSMCYDTHEDLGIYSQLVSKGIPPVARVMRINQTEQMYRSLFLRLQLKRGVDVGEFSARFGETPSEAFPELLNHLSDCGCIEIDDSSIRLTRYGNYFVEDVCCSIIDDAVAKAGYPANYKRLPHSAGARSLRVLAG
ncbi:Oxygen-independent coproporphyrinogen-III oxidase 1 [Enhygromyxa salina]|uniref:Oxygen-independent coproporphyrinogen-III oxidase 1 n=1 Tax=Enhygromyxa salina TaxID=215803 RepID=A0A2S9YGL3_9BACT|nr:radical SAM protein [Enhygromyxa salina]PRQ04248.1 Oxygen-independent coproporphyrinogen-III oxidase 1 [Enhygromyxa salina]